MAQASGEVSGHGKAEPRPCGQERGAASAAGRGRRRRRARLGESPRDRAGPSVPQPFLNIFLVKFK